MTLIHAIITFCGVLVSARYSAGAYQCLENTALVGSVECDTALNILACVRRWHGEATSDAITFQVSNHLCCHGHFGGIEDDRLCQLNDSFVCYKASKINSTIGLVETPTISPSTVPTVTSPLSQSTASTTSTTSPSIASTTSSMSPTTTTTNSTMSPTATTTNSTLSPTTATTSSATSPTTTASTMSPTATRTTSTMSQTTTTTNSTMSPTATTTTSSMPPTTATTTSTMSPDTAKTTSTNVPSFTTAMTSTSMAPTTVDSVPVPCEAGWTVIGAQCFKFFNTLVTWSAAQTSCRNLGGDLAHVYTPGHITQFFQMLPCRENICEPYLGINDIASEGTMVGSQGQAVTADVSVLIAGNTVPNDCSYLDPSNIVVRFWACGAESSFICEKGLNK